MFVFSSYQQALNESFFANYYTGRWPTSQFLPDIACPQHPLLILQNTLPDIFLDVQWCCSRHYFRKAKKYFWYILTLRTMPEISPLAAPSQRWGETFCCSSSLSPPWFEKCAALQAVHVIVLYTDFYSMGVVFPLFFRQCLSKLCKITWCLIDCNDN